MKQTIRRKETFADRALRSRKFRVPAQVYGFLLATVIFGCGFIWGRFVTNPTNPNHGTESIASAPINPPHNLLINGATWSVEAYAFSKNGWKNVGGMTDCDQKIIWYDFDDETVSYQKNILWHEVIHAGHCTGYPKDNPWWGRFSTGLPEHPEVYKLGMFLPGFVHDNPEFMKWAEDWK